MLILVNVVITYVFKELLLFFVTYVTSANIWTRNDTKKAKSRADIIIQFLYYIKFSCAAEKIIHISINVQNISEHKKDKENK